MKKRLLVQRRRNVIDDDDLENITTSVRRLSIKVEEKENIIEPSPSEIREKKRRYNNLITTARNHELKRDFKTALTLYKEAYALFDINEKLSRKIEKLESIVKQLTKQSNTKSQYIKHPTKKKQTITSFSEIPVIQPEHLSSPQKDIKGEDGFFVDPDNNEHYLRIEGIPKRFIIRDEIFKKLYSYQREGIKWLAELHTKDGGILGVCSFVIIKTYFFTLGRYGSR